MAYNAALAINPKFSYALYNRGRLLFDSGNTEQGIADFIASARRDIDLDGFGWWVSEGRNRIIRERGFAAFVR